MTFRISLELSHQCPLESIKDHVSFMEAHGFYRVWVPDTLVSPWEAWLAADFICHHTHRIRIGLGVTNPSTRHPVVMAQMAATMQHFSKGRLAIAMGKGIRRFLEKTHIDQPPSAMAECVVLLQQLISGEHVTLDGDAFKIDGIHLRTVPPDNSVPIFIAATNPDSLQQALATADGITTFWSPDAIEMNRKAKDIKPIHTAALIPFSLTKASFFNNTVHSLEKMENEIKEIRLAGFDEAIIAYGDMEDLEVLAKIS